MCDTIVTCHWVIMIMFQDLIAERNASRHVNLPISPEDIVVIQRIVLDSSRMIVMNSLLHLKIAPRDFERIVQMVRLYSPAGNCVTG
jgi:hypothetical protein